MNRLSKFLLLSILIFSSNLFSQEILHPEGLDELINEALDNNPKIRSLQNVVISFKERVPQVSSLPDPQLNFGVLSLPTDTYKFDQEPMTQKRIGISQKFPFFGKLGKKEEMALADLDMIKYELESAKLNLVKKVKQTYFEYYFIDHSLRITEQNRMLLADFVKIASTKYSSGKGIQHDVLKSQVELLKMEKKIIVLRQKESVVKAKLNTLLNRLPQEVLGKPDSLILREFQVNIDELQDLALKNNPGIIKSEFFIKKNEAANSLAKKEYWPDLMLSVNYGQRVDRPNFLSGVLSINIPLYAGSKQSKRIQETRAGIHAAQYKYEYQKSLIFLQLKTKLDEFEKNKNLVKLYQREILPQAKQALESAISAYQTDKSDFITLLNNQITFQNYEIDFYRFKSDYNKNIADIEALTGIVPNH